MKWLQALNSKTVKQMIAKYLDRKGLLDSVTPNTLDWVSSNLMDTIGKYQMPAGEWLWKGQTDEASTFNQIPDEIRMSAFVVALRAYEEVFGVKLETLDKEQDFLLAFYRTLIMVGWSLKEDHENGRFLSSGGTPPRPENG